MGWIGLDCDVAFFLPWCGNAGRPANIQRSSKLHICKAFQCRADCKYTNDHASCVSSFVSCQTFSIDTAVNRFDAAAAAAAVCLIACSVGILFLLLAAATVCRWQRHKLQRQELPPLPPRRICHMLGVHACVEPHNGPWR